ncbi:MAG TPA: LiaF domain-containing protein [Pseudogracilibacillus sp.]|nr:LiaF domain-containing protein [Pseudogracilibacillus sp.]
MRSRVIIGLLFIILGVGFLLEKLDVVDFTDMLSDWWALIFVLIGLVQLLKRQRGSALPGLFFIVLGVVLLGKKVANINVLEYFWPILIIVLGFLFVFRKRKDRRPGWKTQVASKDILKNTSVFSGSDIRSNSKRFEGGEVTAVFGGAKIDLREAKLVEHGAHLELNVVFGGITLIVPTDVQIEASGTPLFGGWEDKTSNQYKKAEEKVSTLHITCNPLFGGIEIKN